jgi:gamma-glutamylcyclotransferase (GGCT)/AIG2-like uncharacterized protein YtfP
MKQAKPQAKQLLFVYGTLMRSAAGALGKEERERLARESRNLGPAILSGATLYDLGRYPGLRDSEERGDIVHGEALELLDPDRTFIWLDDYEGLASPREQTTVGEYIRAEREISLARGERLTAWVYLLLRDVPPSQRIANGRWSAG